MAAVRASLSIASIPTARAATVSNTRAPKACPNRAVRNSPKAQLRAGGLRLRAVKRTAKVTRAALKVSAEGETVTDSFVPVLKPEDLPKGERQIIQTNNNKVVMLFWYRNEIFAIESRSPAEGAYSSGFKDARLTQDFGIQCPSTGTTFNLKTGEIMDWYPNNPVLRAITPQDTCRPMEVFPVKVTAEAISVDPENSNLTGAGYNNETSSSAGGADTSLENNNVFGIEPKMYLDSGEEIGDSSGAVGKIDPATLAISTVAVAIIAVAGTATCLFYESIPALAAFWILGFGGVAFTIIKFQGNDEK